ncbi:hypothetical protein UlMin_016328 [Ulmus minor]
MVVDPKYFEKTWKILEHAIHDIYNHNTSGRSFEELYRFFIFCSFMIFHFLVIFSWNLEGWAVATAAAVSIMGNMHFLALNFGRAGAGNASSSWISGALTLLAAGMDNKEVHAVEFEHTFIVIKPDGVQRGLISEIISRFERKGFKLVAIKIVVPSKDFAQNHYHDLKERPFFNGLCDFLSSGPVIAMVWEGDGVIKYGRKLIGATDPQKSEPRTIRGDLPVVNFWFSIWFRVLKFWKIE